MFFTNFAVDGVSAESQDVMTTVCKFLDGQARFIGSVDNKHNTKGDRYQLIGGSSLATVGNYVVDCELLQLSGVVKDLWRVHDFASDKLAATLFSYRSLKKFAVGIEDGNAVGLTVDACALALSHAVNGSHIPAKHLALYLYSSMLFFTSISGILMTSKWNAVTETIADLF